MQARIQKWGNSLAVRIPKAMANEAHLAQEAVVELAMREGNIVIEPVKKKKYELKDLIRGITQENLHSEDAWGPSVGREVW